MRAVVLYKGENNEPRTAIECAEIDSHCSGVARGRLVRMRTQLEGTLEGLVAESGLESGWASRQTCGVAGLHSIDAAGGV